MFGSIVSGLSRRARTAHILAAIFVVSAASVLPAPPAEGQTDLLPSAVQEVRTTWAGDYGISHPSGVTYVGKSGEFLLFGLDPSGNMKAARLAGAEDPIGLVAMSSIASPSTISYNSSTDRIAAFESGSIVEFPSSALLRDNPRGTRPAGLQPLDAMSTAYDSQTGEWIVLLRPGNRLARVSEATDGKWRVSHVELAHETRAIAFDHQTQRLFALGDGGILMAIDSTGKVVESYALDSVELVDPSAMVFAPTSDSTDAATNLNLFVADSGGVEHTGALVEISLSAVSAASAPVDTATLVRMTATSGWTPASPDPSGVTYHGSPSQLIIVDSEVDEVTGAGWNNVNMWRTHANGTQLATGAFWGPNAPTYAGKTGFSREPTGAGYDLGTNTLFVSDDNAGKVFVVGRGPDNQHGTKDDVVAAINASSYGSGDTEDPEFDPSTGHLFFLDGVGMEIFRVDPVDGVFGNGNDAMTHFDISHLGPKDFEGLASNVSRGTLYVGARSTKQIFEISKSGELLRVISLTGIPGLKYISGLTVAPASDGSGTMNFYVVDRQVDNGPDPNENDGRLFEVRAPDSLSGGGGPQNQAPAVSAGPDLSVTLPNVASLNGSVSDDGLPQGSTVSVQWSVLTAPPSGSVAFASPTSPSTTATFSTVGTYTLRLTATDTQLTSSDDVTVSVAAAPVTGESFAVSQSTTYGTVAGGLANTYYDDGTHQVLTEELNAQGNRARLDHTWTFNLIGGSGISFKLNAFRSGSEDFRLSYSTDGSKWRNMVVITATADGTEYRYNMPAGTSGTVLVRLRDLDRSRDDRVRDVVSIDRMVFGNG